MNGLFSHKTLKHPPALSKYGQMHSGNKSDLINCIEEIPNTIATVQVPKVLAAVLEGSVLVNLVKPKTNQTLQSHAADEFESQVAKHQREYSPKRIDVVFDTYQQITLKMAIREKCRKGIGQRVQNDSISPTNWGKLHYLSQSLVTNHDHITFQIICAFNTVSISVDPEADLSFVSPCNYEEYDTSVFLDIKDIAMKGNETIVIRTVDTNVLALSISAFTHFTVKVDQL